MRGPNYFGHTLSDKERLNIPYSRGGKPKVIYRKTYVKQPLSKDRKMIFKTNYRLMQVKSIVECSKRSILQYFRPSLSYHLSLRSLFCGFFTQILLYGIMVYVWPTLVAKSGIGLALACILAKVYLFGKDIV